MTIITSLVAYPAAAAIGALATWLAIRSLRLPPRHRRTRRTLAARLLPMRIHWDPDDE